MCTDISWKVRSKSVYYVAMTLHQILRSFDGHILKEKFVLPIIVTANHGFVWPQHLSKTKHDNKHTKQNIFHNMSRRLKNKSFKQNFST